MAVGHNDEEFNWRDGVFKADPLPEFLLIANPEDEVIPSPAQLLAKLFGRFEPDHTQSPWTGLLPGTPP
jgi:hypothetical protein